MVRFYFFSGTAMLLVACLASACGNFASELNYRNQCVPKTCAALGMKCGTWQDGCGDEVDCGKCQGIESCRADGQCVSQCQGSTCETMDRECGTWNDGCFSQIDCGTCETDQTCNALGRCVDTGLVQEDRVSDCGGFEAGGDNLFDAPRAYCDAEVLHWLYEQASQTLKLADARVFLNCCGDHSMTVQKQDGLYLVTEIDAPEGGWGRCSCMCVFDFVVEVQGVPPGVIRLKVVREVTDREDSPSDVFDGEIDLSTGSGSFVVDEEDVGPWCTNP